MRLLTALALTSLLVAPASAAKSEWAAGQGVRLERVASGLRSPVHLASNPGDARLFIVEQRGTIMILDHGRMLPDPFLDLTDRVTSGGERGLLSVAFHPDYARNGFLFVNYTDRHGDTRVERYHVSRDSNRADPASGTFVIGIAQPFANHNGGHLLFGPDGLLYIGMGDGGSAGDPNGNGQNRGTLLAKLLRIDVTHGRPYTIPPDNPFVRTGGDARPEIWALGLRNPWRFWIDPPTGLLYIADVGQNQWEELDVAPLKSAGLNYGWNRFEGSHPFRGPASEAGGFVAPALEYPHDEGCSITGGVVYRGARIPALRGCYLFSDYCQGWVRSVRYENGRIGDRREWRFPGLARVTSFGVGGDGEVYVLGQGGEVWRFEPAP